MELACGEVPAVASRKQWVELGAGAVLEASGLAVCDRIREPGDFCVPVGSGEAEVRRRPAGAPAVAGWLAKCASWELVLEDVELWSGQRQPR